MTLGKPDVVAWMSWPKQPVKLAVVLSGTEIEKLLEAMSSPMFHVVAMVMYGAGLRISEACALRVPAVRRWSAAVYPGDLILVVVGVKAKIAPENLARVNAALFAVVNDPKGTAYPYGIPHSRLPARPAPPRSAK